MIHSKNPLQTNIRTVPYKHWFKDNIDDQLIARFMSVPDFPIEIILLIIEYGCLQHPYSLNKPVPLNVINSTLTDCFTTQSALPFFDEFSKHGHSLYSAFSYIANLNPDSQ